MISSDSRTSFCLDSNLHVIDDEVYLDAAGQTPVAEAGESFGVGVVGAQLVKYPILESLAIEFRTGSHFTAFGQMVHDARIQPLTAEIAKGFGNQKSEKA